MKVVPVSSKIEYAPAPSKGLALALYETIEAIGGPSSMAEIKKLLPAALNTASKAGLTDEHIARTLYWSVYSGFLVTTKTGEYQIAPKSYWRERRDYIRALQDARRDRVRNEDGETVTVTERKWDMASFYVGFIVGVLAGTVILASIGAFFTYN